MGTQKRNQYINYTPEREIRNKIRKMLKFASTIDQNGTMEEINAFYSKLTELQARLHAS